MLKFDGFAAYSLPAGPSSETKSVVTGAGNTTGVSPVAFAVSAAAAISVAAVVKAVVETAVVKEDTGTSPVGEAVEAEFAVAAVVGLLEVSQPA
jgi:hypothetical protein